MDRSWLKKANIDNLTGLWKKMGTLPTPALAVQELNASKSWPHRYWFDWGTDTNKISGLDEALDQLPSQAMFPVWGESAEIELKLKPLIIENRFRVDLEQTAMSLCLTKYKSEPLPHLDIKQIHSTQNIETWAAIASESFGYQIDVTSILKVADDADVQILLIYHEGQPAATAMLHKTGEIIGVHLVGVPKKFGGRGIAYLLMQHVIESCHAWGGKYITLQSSAAGQSIYQRLGFNEQFIIRSYRRIA
jgi:GNAT superfamily N-acetyltransferase